MRTVTGIHGVKDLEKNIFKALFISLSFKSDSSLEIAFKKLIFRAIDLYKRKNVINQPLGPLGFCVSM